MLIHFKATQVIWQAGTCFVQQKADVSTLHIYFGIIGLCIEFIKFYLSPYMLQLDIANKSYNSALVYNKHV